VTRAFRALAGAAITFAVTVAGALSAAGAPVNVSSKGLGATTLTVTLTTGSVRAAADTFSNQLSPNTNVGTSTSMNVQCGFLWNERSFVRFDLSAIPRSARVQTATLQLTMASAPSASSTYEVDRVLSTWSETSLTWNNMPSAAPATATVDSGTTSGVNLTWDVTPDVQTFVASSSANFGWQIRDSDDLCLFTRTAVFRTDEFGTAAQRPVLTVTYAT
jgi:hypothetical protein